MKNVYEQMEEQNARENVAAFLQKQALPYEAKKTAAKQRVLEYYHEMCNVRNANVHVSVGGLDSITLFIFIRDYCHLDVPGISASTTPQRRSGQAARCAVSESSLKSDRTASTGSAKQITVSGITGCTPLAGEKSSTISA